MDGRGGVSVSSVMPRMLARCARVHRDAGTFGCREGGPRPARRCRSTPPRARQYVRRGPSRPSGPDHHRHDRKRWPPSPDRLRRGRSEATQPARPSATGPAGQELEFVAYGEDCLLSGQRPHVVRPADATCSTSTTSTRSVGVHRRAARRRRRGRAQGGPRHARRAAPRPRHRAARQRRASTPHAAEPGGHEGRAVRRPGLAPRLCRAPIPIESIRRRKAMVPLTDARIDYRSGTTVRAPARSTSSCSTGSRSTGSCPPSTTCRRSRTCRSCRPTPSPGRCSRTSPGPCSTSEVDPPAVAPRRYASSVTDTGSSADRSRHQRPAGRPARHRRARRSSPGRTARCCWATWGPRSSRSSRPRATPPAAGGRRGSAATVATARRRRTAAYYLAVNRNKRGLRLDLKTAGRGGDPAAAARRWRRPGRELPGRRVRPARASTTRRSRALNPRLVHLAISGYGPAARPRTGPATTSSIQAASGLMSITGAADADGGEPTKVGVAISDVVTGMLGAVGRPGRARRARAGGRAGRRRGPAGRRLAARVDPGEPRQPGPERVRQRRRARAGSATPTRTSSRTRPSRRPTARSRSRSGRSGSGRGCARRSACPTLAERSALRHQRRPGRATSRAAPDPGRALRRPNDGRLARAPSMRPRSRAGPINDVVGRVRVARGRRARDDRRAGASGLGRDPPGRRSRSSWPRRRPSIRTPPPTLGQDTDAILAELGYGARGGRRAARRRGRLRRRDGRAQSSWRRNDQAREADGRGDQDDRRDDRRQDIARRRPARP